MDVVFAPKNVLRYPRLDTVLMVERAAAESQSEKTVSQLWKALPKKVMWPTYLLILDYLAETGKILIAKDRRVVWVWNPALLGKVRKAGVEV